MSGGITWRIKYRIDGKEKIYSIGSYPLVSLAVARVELSETKALLRENKDPVIQRRINRAESIELYRDHIIDRPVYAPDEG